MSRDWIAGKNAVLETLRVGKRRVHILYCCRDRRDETIEAILQMASEQGIPVKETNPKELAFKTGVESHQGVGAETDPFIYTDLSDVVSTCLVEPKGSFVILLDEIQDPQNLGSLIRTAYLTGSKGMILQTHRSATVTPTVCKVAVGATEHLSIVQEVNLNNCINLLKKKEFFIIGTEGKEGRNWYDFEPSWPLALVLGSEEKGLRKQVRESCDALVSLPMEGHLDSYNVSVAGALFMGELLRRKKCSKTF